MVKPVNFLFILHFSLWQPLLLQFRRTRANRAVHKPVHYFIDITIPLLVSYVRLVTICLL